MVRFLKITAALGAFFMLAQPSWAAAQRVVRVVPRAVIVRPYYGWGPGWGWYNPWWGPAYVVPQANTGEVKLVTRMKEAQVYVDGGYAGLAGKLKHFDLSPGNHNIELRDTAGQKLFQQQIQVIRDKTTEIRVD